MDIAILLFPEITALDAIGPYEVLARLPHARVRFVAEQPGLVRADNGMLALSADYGFSDVTACDLLLVPGGFGARKLQAHPPTLDFIRTLDQTTRLTTSVCTGALLLAATGLLRGRRATTHWAHMEQLGAWGAIPTGERYVRDGKYASAAGVSAGIDLALALALELAGREVAEAVQLSIEYDPKPPLDAGNPKQVSAALRERLYKLNHKRDAELPPLSYPAR